MQGRNRLKTLAVSAAMLTFAATSASAGGYIQTLGIGQKSSSLAGAVTATADDFDAFYTNPAGAANFDTPLIGGTLKVVSSLPYEFEDGAGNKVIDTLQGQSVGLLPANGAYLPLIPGSVVAGFGIGAPFALAVDFKDQPFGQIRANEDAADFELIYVEASPLIAVRVTDWLNVGAAINFGVAKHFKQTIRFDDLAGLGIAGSFYLQTDDDVPVPMAPWGFSTDPSAITFTLGAQAQLAPTLKFGITYREETPNQFEGQVRLFTQVPPDLLLGLTSLSVCVGPPEQAGVCDVNLGIDRFRVDMELPRHLQFGFAWQALPNWELSFDAQWTNWSAATGFGSPIVQNFTQSQSVNPRTNFRVGVGASLNLLAILPAVRGQIPLGIDRTFIDFEAEDAWSFMVGSKFDLNDTWSFLSGYQYDQQLAEKHYVADPAKHYITGGIELTMPTERGEWTFDLGGQLVLYEDDVIPVGQSTTLGGLGPNASLGGFSDGPNPGNNAITPTNAVGAGINEDRFEIGGYIWTVGASATLRM